MTKKISEKLVIGNALYSTNREYLTREQVCNYWHIVDGLLPEGYYTNGNNNSFSDFCEEYPFLVKRVGDRMMINCEKTLLERYCRMGVPTEIIKAFNQAGVKLNEIEEKNQINYNEENLEDLSRHIEEGKEKNSDGKVWRMGENTGVPCDVKISEESRKILAKTLLK